MAKIEVKFNLGDEVFTFEKNDDDELLINRGKIEQICVYSNDVLYYVDDKFIEYEENDLLNADCTSDDLYEKIYELTKKVENGPESTQGR